MCSLCGVMTPVPEEAARRREHVSPSWCCLKAGLGGCNAASAEYALDGFDVEVCKAFSGLLTRPADLISQMRCMGGARQEAGGGCLALPTIIHRGPGQPAHLRRPRRVLFFSVRPIYGNELVDEALVYDSSTQIHAGWLLCKPQITDAHRADVEAKYRELGHELNQFREEVLFVAPCNGLHGVPNCVRPFGHRGRCTAILTSRCHRTLGCIRPMGHGGSCHICRARPHETSLESQSGAGT